MGQVLTIEPDKAYQVIQKAVKLHDDGELDEAYKLIEDHLAEFPDDAQALNVAASILKKAKKTPVALAVAHRAAALKPERPEPWGVIGACQQHLWHLDDAMASYRKALKLAHTPKQRALYLNNIGSTFIDQGKFKEAEQWIRDSLEVEYDPLASHNLGLSLLAQKKWEEGWSCYSHSIGTFNRINWKYKTPPEPTWDGTKGQSVVVYGEQGIGDEICFASMIPDAAKDARVVVDCDKRLAGLFKRSFPQCKVYGTRTDKQLVWDAEDRDMDASISMGELGKFYRKSDEDFSGAPYLTPCPDRTAGWRSVFSAKRKPTIGIAWNGGTWENGAKFRHVPLDLWRPVFTAIDAHWVNLEYKDKREEAAAHGVATYPWATLTKD